MILHSKLDSSVNIYNEQFEARYVHRPNTDYIIAYLSSQKGCNQACRFCHLTQQKQTSTEQATLDDYLSQLLDVLLVYHDDVKKNKLEVKKIHINFMARGEALLNLLVQDPLGLFNEITIICNAYGLEPKFNVSTIMPNGFVGKLISGSNVEYYWSYYSGDPVFQRRWMPNAMPTNEAIDLLKTVPNVIHRSIIQNANDYQRDSDDLLRVAHQVKARKINIIRYNPFSEAQGTESRYLPDILDYLSQRYPTKLIERVGFDVKASCGMFIKDSRP